MKILTAIAISSFLVSCGGLSEKGPLLCPYERQDEIVGCYRCHKAPSEKKAYASCLEGRP